MNFTQFTRKQFSVEAVEITEENFEEIAAIVGEIREKDGAKWIAVDRRVVPSVNRAYVGWFMTRLGDNYRCYSPKVFHEQFVADDTLPVDPNQEVLPLDSPPVMDQSARVPLNVFTEEELAIGDARSPRHISVHADNEEADL